MKIIKVDGNSKSYIMENGDSVPFSEIKDYQRRMHYETVTLEEASDVLDLKPKRRRKMKDY